MGQFVDRVAAVLNINDQSRIKIVGVYSGSARIVTLIEPSQQEEEGTTTDSNSTSTNTTEPTIERVSTRLQEAIDNGEFASSLSSVSEVLATESVLFTDPTADEQAATTDDGESGPSKLGLILGMIMGVAVVVSLIGVICCMFAYRRYVSRNISLEKELEFEMDSRNTTNKHLKNMMNGHYPSTVRASTF